MLSLGSLSLSWCSHNKQTPEPLKPTPTLALALSIPPTYTKYEAPTSQDVD